MEPIEPTITGAVDFTPKPTEVGAVADLVTKHVKARVVSLAVPGAHADVPVLVLPTGLQAFSAKDFADEYRTAPERREGTARLVELESFIDHVNRFKDDDSALFALPSGAKLTAVFDYHRRCNLPPDEDGVESTHVDGAPRFGKHRAEYSFPLSDEWRAWADKNGKLQSQAEFAGFLEDRVIDVADPQSAFASAKKFADALGISSFASPTRLLQLSRGLTIHVDERVTSKIDPSTGETTMLFSTEHNDEQGAPLAIPRAFLLQIPVFRAGVAYQFAVRLKYRTGGGKVQWCYEIHDAIKALDDAFREACMLARDHTDLPLFYGSPEA